MPVAHALPLNDEGLRRAPAFHAYGVESVTTLSLRQENERVVTYRGSAGVKKEREHGCEAEVQRATSEIGTAGKRNNEAANEVRRRSVSGKEMTSPPARTEATARRRRCDCGSVGATERDLELLYLVGEQYAVTLPQIARLIGRSVHTARALRDRWKKARWVGSGQLSIQAPSFVWLTGRGAVGVESPFRVWQPNHGLALHIEAVTDVRLLLQHELRLGKWECERAVAQQFAKDRDRRGHLPDAVLHQDGERIAIEVELTLKSRARLGAIVDELSEDYDRVWYFAPERFRAALSGLATDAPYANVAVYRYPPLAAEVAASAP